MYLSIYGFHTKQTANHILHNKTMHCVYLREKHFCPQTPLPTHRNPVFVCNINKSRYWFEFEIFKRSLLLYGSFFKKNNEKEITYRNSSFMIGTQSWGLTRVCVCMCDSDVNSMETYYKLTINRNKTMCTQMYGYLTPHFGTRTSTKSILSKCTEYISI